MTNNLTLAERVEAAREYLLLASYCGGDNPKCTKKRPCADCLAMCNVFDANGKFIRSHGSGGEG